VEIKDRTEQVVFFFIYIFFTKLIKTLKWINAGEAKDKMHLCKAVVLSASQDDVCRDKQHKKRSAAVKGKSLTINTTFIGFYRKMSWYSMNDSNSFI